MSTQATTLPLDRAVFQVSLFRLYTLRVAYLILGGGLVAWIWPTVIHHTVETALNSGVRLALFAGLGAIALLGLRYPVRMLPILLFEILWKAVYLLAFAYPLWSAHQLTPAAAEDVNAVLMVVIFLPLIPWGYVVRQYVLAPGDRWR